MLYKYIVSSKGYTPSEKSKKRSFELSSDWLLSPSWPYFWYFKYKSSFGHCSILLSKSGVNLILRKKEEDSINIQEISNELFKEDPTKRQDFEVFMKGNGLEEEVAVDKAWVEKKLKRVRLKIDKDIDLYINEEAYHDNSKFEIQRNGDGSINMIIKHVINYIEK